MERKNNLNICWIFLCFITHNTTVKWQLYKWHIQSKSMQRLHINVLMLYTVLYTVSYFSKATISRWDRICLSKTQFRSFSVKKSFFQGLVDKEKYMQSWNKTFTLAWKPIATVTLVQHSVTCICTIHILLTTQSYSLILIYEDHLL